MIDLLALCTNGLFYSESFGLAGAELHAKVISQISDTNLVSAKQASQIADQILASISQTQVETINVNGTISTTNNQTVIGVVK